MHNTSNYLAGMYRKQKYYRFKSAAYLTADYNLNDVNAYFVGIDLINQFNFIIKFYFKSFTVWDLYLKMHNLNNCFHNKFLNDKIQVEVESCFYKAPQQQLWKCLFEDNFFKWV